MRATSGITDARLLKLAIDLVEGMAKLPTP